ncbi:hypothetical protein GCM10011416_10340 [Polaribacter pacificus]|uniref:Uncharacterized protein n=1 Tax=Polaribacter pacificus TaxID=1775173 RepID=A0A917MD28_9FLAO|nr:hypothetical protein [Polaribacter pacificus]GGG94837.1 hypothetical protein GCM10011416_10340 [Polaribacter pacificus]
MSKLSKILTGVAAVIAVIGFYYFVMILNYGEDAIKSDPDVQGSTISPFVTFSVIVLVLAIASAVIFSVINMVKNPESLKKTLLSLAVLAVIFAVAYMFSKDTSLVDAVGNKDWQATIDSGEAGSISKWVDTGIRYSVVLGAIGLGLFVVDIVKGLIK